MLEHWDLVRQDLHDVYGIDTGDRQLMADRSWHWLANRVAGLLNHPTRLTRLATALHPQRGDTDGA